MNIILLSGGSGKRLWPFVNGEQSKQFLPVLTDENNRRISMCQYVYRKIMKNIPDADITIATNQNQVDIIKKQIGTEVSISEEPCQRDTFPAISLALAYLRDVKHKKQDDIVIICPIDTYADDSFFVKLIELEQAVENTNSDLMLMGITPRKPDSKYGYILPENQNPVCKVLSFIEKPDKEKAQELILKNALWNCGVFAVRLGHVLSIAETLVQYSGYDYLLSNYAALPKISFDYQVVEKEKNLHVLRFSGNWRDIGSWETLSEVANFPESGEAYSSGCTNTTIINNTNIPVMAIGLENLVIACNSNGILVTKKTDSEKINQVSLSTEQNNTILE